MSRNVPQLPVVLVEPSHVTNENFPHASNRLFHIQIGVTYACQCRCSHCGVSDQKNLGELLSVAEIVDLCRQARNDMNAQVVELFGGEPLVRKEIREIVAGCSRHLDVWMSTNGMGFTREMAEDLARAGLKRVFFSLDSPDPATHDRNRNREGCFDAVQRGVEYCNELGIDANFSTCAMARLIESDEVRKLIQHTRTSGARKIRLVLPKMSGRFSQNQSVLLNADEIEQIRQLTAANDVAYVEAEGNFEQNVEKCFCLRGHMYINPYGVVQPCVYTLLNYGNVRDYPIRFLYDRMFHHPVFRDKSILNLCLLQNPSFVETYQSTITAKHPIADVPLNEDGPLKRFSESTGSRNEDDQSGVRADAEFLASSANLAKLFEACGTDLASGATAACLGPASATVRRAFQTACPDIRVKEITNLSAAARHSALQGTMDLIFSHALLHHLDNPVDLWRTVEHLLKPGAAFLVVDVVRPTTVLQARETMHTLKPALDMSVYRELYGSLLAAWRIDEIEAQLRKSNLVDISVTRVNDLHVAIRGNKPRA